MKFVVQKSYAGEVDVKLHWETKEKLQKALLWTTYVAGAVTYVAFKRKKSLEGNPQD